MKQNITVRIVGESGEGIISTGEILSRILAEIGKKLMTFRTYPAEIKGGQCLFQLRFSDDKLHTPGEQPEILICFDEKSYFEHGMSKEDGILIYNSDDTAPENGDSATTLGIPFTTISRDEIGVMQSKNMVALGAIGYILKIEEKTLLDFAGSWFRRKGDKTVQANTAALKAGYEFAQKNITRPGSEMRAAAGEETVLLSGNQALVLGALAAGCRFYAGYPITPASNIMELMIRELPRFGGIGIQTEDEIAAAAACIGASFAGKKAMTATSGPGFSLMQEQLGLASMAEIPVVVVDAQRAGPSTGMPTKMEQGDLLQAIHGAHGEAPRVVIAPGTVEECFSLTVHAFNMAESLRCPVVILSDLALAQRTASIPVSFLEDYSVLDRPLLKEGSDDFKPFDTSEVVTPMAIPGQEKGVYVATGLEHDELGRPNYTPAVHQQMVEKRHAKLNKAFETYRGYELFFDGDESSQLGIVSWGSTEGPLREALELLAKEGIFIPLLQVKLLNPLPVEAIKAFGEKCGKLVVAEHNYEGQLAGMIDSIVAQKVNRLNKVSGLPWYPSELVEELKSMLNG